jgi:DNA-binding beta-propeller fold protein YncE
MISKLLPVLAGCFLLAAAELPNGWRITPIGQQIRLAGDFPARIVQADATHIVVLTAGFHDQGLSLIDVSRGETVARLPLGNVYGDFLLDPKSKQISVAGANSAVGIYRIDFDGKRFGRVPTEVMERSGQSKRFVSDIALGRDGALFVVDLNGDTIERLAPSSRAMQSYAKTGYGPYRVAVSPDGATVAVTDSGDAAIELFSADQLRRVAKIRVGIHPNELMFSPDGRLFVSNAGSNEISVIRGTRLEETIKTSLRSSDKVGSTPDALAIDRPGKTLFVANADNNDVAVIDISQPGHSEIEGFIPTGWYPSALAVSRDGKSLYVGVAKGLGFQPNVPGDAKAITANSPVPYDTVGETLTGYVSIVPIPSSARLRELTRMVIADRPSGEASGLTRERAKAIRATAFAHLKHVVYIIRENRTYDQVLGDLGKGNGDPALTLFGEDVTPNAHRLAREFVLLDNLYVNGEVSENGHQWSDAAYASQFTSQAWLRSYSGREEPKKHESELGADERLRSSPAGYLWDNCAHHGISYRSYGEFAYFHPGPDAEPRFVAKGLEGHASLEWLKLASSGWNDVSKGRDPDLAKIFIREMRTAERTGEWPRFMVLSLGEDHTHALRPGHYTPSAMVASNDQALGQIVDAVSHSRFWAETAIFIIEDDAQDGPDHVDARRTVGFVISPYTKRRIVDHSFYTTASMIHAMELILGLPTMTQFDAAAAPMYPSFDSVPNLAAYTNAEPRVNLFAKNPARGPDAEASLKLDFSEYDRVDPAEMNRILWKALKAGAVLPAPVRSAFQ